jgi:aconitate hydratase
MRKSITQKVLEEHIVEGEWAPGAEIAITIDQTLTQDATGTMAYLQFEAMRLERVKTELSLCFIDHNTVQAGFENADDHRYLQSIAAKYGILFSKAGNGICHQVHLERFGKPGKTLLGSDSHTPTGGGIGMIAIGAGGLDVAVAMGGGPFYLASPEVIKLNVKGVLHPWVTAKDVALKVLETFTTKGNVGCVFEYGGKGVTSLSVPERATITNMGAECGVTTSVFPSDDTTRRFLHAQSRARDWIELKADNDAEYDLVTDIDLDEIVPLAACPHSPDNVKPVKELEGMVVDQVCVGSCTNASYKDMMTVARIVKGKKVHPDVEFVVAPGSKQVLESICRAGALADLISAGARIAECTCGFCIGNSYAPATDAVSVRTSNRNFPGRSGTKSANVFLVSPETAAATAITGKMTDPRSLGMAYPSVQMPEKFTIDDSMILQPADAPERVVIYRGPNIGEPPSNSPLPEAISGLVAIKVGDKITTDHIIPAGSRMKYRSNIAKYAKFVFETVDTGFYKRAVQYRDKGWHNIIVAGESYGQGSSREHAALCPAFLGVKAVIAKSFERIHAANLVNFGIVPLIFESESDYDFIGTSDELEIPDIRTQLSNNVRWRVRNKTRGIEFEVGYELSERQRKIILAGGLLPYVTLSGTP